MCGIGGAINYKHREITVETIGQVADSIRHRGPDDHGFYFATTGRQTLTRDLSEGFGFNVSLLHRRLSILDLTERGWQPMQTPDKRYTITYNVRDDQNVRYKRSGTLNQYIIVLYVEFRLFSL